MQYNQRGVHVFYPRCCCCWWYKREIHSLINMYIALFGDKVKQWIQEEENLINAAMCAWYQTKLKPFQTESWSCLNGKHCEYGRLSESCFQSSSSDIANICFINCSCCEKTKNLSLLWDEQSDQHMNTRQPFIRDGGHSQQNIKGKYETNTSWQT